MNCTASSACSVLRKWLPTADCSTSLTRLRIVPTIEITFGALGVGHVDLHLQVDLEDEALAALADDRRQLRVEVVRLRRGVGPVEREDERRHDLGRVHARVDRVLAGAQRLLPDAAVARAHDRAELELRARRVERSGSPTKPLITATSPWFTTSIGTRSTRTRNGFSRYAP